MTETMSIDAYHALGKRSKFGNRKVPADGYTFDSQMEYTRYLYLKARVETGEIWLLKIHPRYELARKFTDNLGNKHQAINYEADFCYRIKVNGRIFYVVEDVKGKKTAHYKDKAKLFRAKYPEYYFFEVTKNDLAMSVEGVLETVRVSHKTASNSIAA